MGNILNEDFQDFIQSLYNNKAQLSLAELCCPKNDDIIDETEKIQNALAIAMFQFLVVLPLEELYGFTPWFKNEFYASSSAAE